MEGKRQRGPRKRGNRNRRKSRDRNGKAIVGCLVEDGASTGSEKLAQLSEHFGKHKSLLLLMDYHTFVIDVKGKNPIYGCQTCKTKMTSQKEVEDHINIKDSHRNRLYSDRLRLVVSKLTPASSTLQKLDQFLEKEIASSCFTRQSYERNMSIFVEIRSLVLNILPEANLEIVGSTHHGLGLDTCDLNMSLFIDDKSIFDSLKKLSSRLERTDNCHQFKIRFTDHRQPPAMYFAWKGFFPCQILILNDNSHKLAKLLKEYGKYDDRCRKLCVLFRKWSSLCGIDSQTDGSWPSHVVYLMVIFFLQRTTRPILPVLTPLIPTFNGPYESHQDVLDSVRSSWTTSNTDSVAELWVEMLTFYCHQFDSSTNAVCITDSLPFVKLGSAWSGKRLAVMDPFKPDKNLTRTVCNSTMYDYIINCLKTTCVYFMVPQFVEGPIFGTIHPDPIVDGALNVPGYEAFLEIQMQLSHYIVRLIPHLDTNYIVDCPDELPVILNKIHSMKGLYVNTCCINMADFEELSTRKNPKRQQYKNYSLHLRDALYLMSRIDSNKLHYKFDAVTFTSGVAIPKCCVICAKNDHTQRNCPDVILDKLKPVVVDDELFQLIDQVCLKVYKQSIPTFRDSERKEKVLYYLQDYVFSLFTDASLTLFGSSQNGFGLHNSDMDICLTFKNCPSSDGLPKNTLSMVFRHLKKNGELRNVILIQNAKVPIIKFLHSPTNLEGDISLYNVLAQENTKLLRTYSEIDGRVKILGYMIKRLAKTCNIGDASKGSLSSYCYILMMIYFLQRCDPPILPVLQELPANLKPLPTRTVEGWNTYFFDNLPQLKSDWPEYGRNNKTSGELWVEFLTFYTEKFDSEHLVVSIRSSSDVSKLEKRWFCQTLAIEDPFVLDHNLGGGLTDRMHYFILKAFGKARNLFTTKLQPSNNLSIVKMYFNTELLAKYEPPFSRGCHACKSIGHKVGQCPERFQKDRLREMKKDSSSVEKQPDTKSKPSAEVEMSKGRHNVPSSLKSVTSSMDPGTSKSPNFPTSFNNPKSTPPAVDLLHVSPPAVDLRHVSPTAFYGGTPLLQTQMTQAHAYQSIVNQLKRSNWASSKQKPFK